MMSLIGGVILQLFLGSFFLFQNISIYILSFYYQYGYSVSYNFIFAVDLVLVASIWFGYYLGTYLLQTLRWHCKLVVALGAGTALAGVYISSFTTNIWIFLITYCMMNGLGIGSCYFIPLVCGWEYFPNRKGLVSGIILAGYGFSSFIFA